MKKGKIAAEIILLAVLCLCLASGYKEGADIKEDGLSDGNVRVLSWFSDMPLWYPEEWEKDPGTGTGKITEQTGVAINYMVPDDNGDSRLSLMMINGKLPDIISVSDTNMIRHLIESGEVWKIEELMNTYLPDSHLLADYPEDVKKELIRRDGDWYGLSSELHSPLNQKKYGEPEEFYRELLQLGNRCGIIWNKALLKRLGLSPNGPRTEEEILEIFEMVMEKEITVNAKPVIPLLVDGRNYQETTFPVLLSFFGAGWVDEEGGYQERIMADGSRHAIRFLNQMDAEGLNVTARSYTATISNFSYCVGAALAQANAIMTGWHIGAGELEECDRGTKRAAFVGVCVAVCMETAIVLGSGFIMPLFTDNPEMTALVRKLLAIDIVLEIGRVTNLVFGQALKTSGDAVFPAVIAAVFMFVFAVGGTWLFGISMGLMAVGAYIGLASDECVRAVGMVWRWKTGKWRTKKLV